MGRLSRPLNKDAVRKTDDEFYAKHPELIKNGKRIPLSATQSNQADLREEWIDLYKKHGGKVKDNQNQGSEKTTDDPIQPCPLQNQNWIELEYLYCDDTGVAGAHYYVINNDNGTIIAQGILDAAGYAWCGLPESVDNIFYNFDKDPPTVEYLKQPVTNPELPKVKEGWLERMADNIAAAGSWTWGTIQGDFNEDQTLGQVATNAVITMIPIIDQAGDVRDITANLKFLIWDKRYDDKWVWIALVLTLIGLIPVLGSAAKGVLKTVAKGLKTGAMIPLKRLIEVLNKFHKGNAIKWLRKLVEDLPSHAVTIKRKLREILEGLRDQLKSLADILPSSLSQQAEDAVNSIDEVAKMADSKIDEAVKELQDGLNKSLAEGVDFEKKGVTKSKNTRKQTAIDSPNLPQERKIAADKVTPKNRKWEHLTLSNRHLPNQVSIPKKTGNTMLMITSEEAAADLAEIRKLGDTIREGETFTVSSGRIYKIHNNSVHPISGPNTVDITSAEYNILVTARKKSFENAQKSLERMTEKGILSPEQYNRTKMLLDFMSKKGK